MPESTNFYETLNFIFIDQVQVYSKLLSTSCVLFLNQVQTLQFEETDIPLADLDPSFNERAPF